MEHNITNNRASKRAKKSHKQKLQRMELLKCAKKCLKQKV